MGGLQLILTTVIAVLGSFAALGFFVSWQLSPLKKDIEHLREGQKTLEAGQTKLEAKIDQLIASSKLK